MSLLEVQHVFKTFREGHEPVHVLQGITLSVAAGEVLALEGPSGSGKTTLLCIAGCILTPTSGSVLIDGRDVADCSGRQLAAVRRKSIGFIFQQYNLFPALTAVENVEYALNVRGWRGKAARREAEVAIDSVGLADRRSFLPSDLSGGQKQRVAIARAIASKPPLLLADEPTGNLDSETGAQTLELFRSLARQQGQALVIVTHDPKVRDIADRVVHIRDGRLVA